MFKGLRKTILQLAYILFVLLEILSAIGMIASLFVMIWLQIVLGIKILLSCFILFLVFKSLSDKIEEWII